MVAFSQMKTDWVDNVIEQIINPPKHKPKDIFAQRDHCAYLKPNQEVRSGGTGWGDVLTTMPCSIKELFNRQLL